jgi:hypothetical protein
MPEIHGPCMGGPIMTSMFHWKQTSRKTAFIQTCVIHAGFWCGVSLLSLVLGWRSCALVSGGYALVHAVLIPLGYVARDRHAEVREDHDRI